MLKNPHSIPNAIRRKLLPVVARVMAGAGFLLGPAATALPLKFESAQATYEPPGESGKVAECIDGVSEDKNGWRLDGGQFTEQTGIFTLKQPVSSSVYQVQISCLSSIPRSHPACFVVSVTTDPNPSLRSVWTPLIPNTAFLDDFSQVEEGGIEFQGGRIIIRPHKRRTVLTVRAPAPVGNVTAFSLQLLPLDFDKNDKLPASLGCDAEGSLTLTELRIESDPMRSTNIAIGRQVKNSGPVVRYLPTSFLTDGFGSTFTHPVNPGGAPFYFELDMGRDIDLDHIILRGRCDGLAPERLSRYRVQLLRDEGSPPVWEALMHAEGYRPEVGGSDLIQASDGKGAFRGRHLRILNLKGRADSPQIAELEVYPALHPVVKDWVVDGAVLNASSELEIPAQKKRIDFTIAATEVPSVSDLITYRWKMVGWQDAWQEVDATGKASMTSLPPEGHYRLIAQARHTDGHWDHSEANVAFSIAPPWWRQTTTLAGLLALIGIGAWIVAWRISVRRMKLRLVLAEARQSLDRERLRIARDMHDEVGARLTGLALLADRCRRTGDAGSLENLAQEARSAVESLDEVVWSINPHHDTVGSFTEHLQDHASSYLAAAGIRCLMDIDFSRPDLMMGLTERHHLLMASKEALQNIVKHAMAREVRLVVRQADDSLTLEISDDGRGLPADPSHPQGDGLGNMHQRLHEAGGRSEIRSSPAGGTTVTFHLPLNPVPRKP